MNNSYKEIISRWQKQIAAGELLLGVSSGSGMTARYNIQGGCDMILALNSGKFRQMGLGSLAGFLPYENSNQMVKEFAVRELLRYNSAIPVIFGVNATDPTINIYELINEIKRLGFSGVNNYPTIGLIDGKFREALEEEGNSYALEVETIRFAQYCGLVTVAFVFDEQQARDMARVGADVVCAHFGLTRGGLLGATQALSLEHARFVAERIFQAASEVNPEVIKMVYGGPIKRALDAHYVYQRSSCQGFIGGSSLDRIPIESAIQEVTRSFKDKKPISPSTEWEKILYGSSENYNYVEFVKEYISEHYMNEVRLSDLAMVAHISPAYLSTLFKKQVGCNFRDYLLSFRMNKARELITGGGFPLVQVAQMVGYQDYPQFSKMYKKHFNVPPSRDK